MMLSDGSSGNSQKWFAEGKACACQNENHKTSRCKRSHVCTLLSAAHLFSSSTEDGEPILSGDQRSDFLGPYWSQNKAFQFLGEDAGCRSCRLGLHLKWDMPICHWKESWESCQVSTFDRVVWSVETNVFKRFIGPPILKKATTHSKKAEMPQLQGLPQFRCLYFS